MPLYKEKGDIRECGSYRGIRLLSVLRKVIECTDEAIGGGGPGQFGFRKGMSSDQFFSVMQICERMLETH